MTVLKTAGPVPISASSDELRQGIREGSMRTSRRGANGR